MIHLLPLVLPLVVVWLRACIGRGLVRCCLIGRDSLGQLVTRQVPLPTRHGIKSLLLLCACSCRLLPLPKTLPLSALGTHCYARRSVARSPHRAFGYEKHTWCERLPDGRIQRWRCSLLVVVIEQQYHRTAVQWYSTTGPSHARTTKCCHITFVLHWKVANRNKWFGSNET